MLQLERSCNVGNLSKWITHLKLSLGWYKISHGDFCLKIQMGMLCLVGGYDQGEVWVPLLL